MATNNKPVKCALLNPQSVVNKTEVIRELINEFSLDILVLCETWLKIDEKSNATTIRKMLPNTHIFKHIPRPRNIHGGGVGIFLSKVFTEVKVNNTVTYKTFEHLDIDFNYKREKVKFIVIYRPPKIDGRTDHKQFREDIQQLLNTLVDSTRKIYICGDFNLWVDDPTDSNASKFIDIMDSANYTNHITAPTAEKGHTLDLVLSNKELCNVRNVEVEPDSPYVHRLVKFELDLKTHVKVKKKISFRKKSGLRPDILITNALEAMTRIKMEECTCVLNGMRKADCSNCLTEIYNKTLKSLYEEMCPIVEKEICVTDREPWFNSTIREARKKRRRLENEWRKNKTNTSRLNYTKYKNEVNRLILKRKEEYYRSKAMEGKGDMKKLKTLFDDLLGKTKDTVLPAHSPDLAQNFANFFEEKINNIYSSFNGQDNVNSHPMDPTHSKMTHFEPICWDDYTKMLKKAKMSYCVQDPLPFGDLMDATNINELLKMQLEIINKCLVDGVFPNSEKIAIIKPTLKNKLDPQELGSYRPVSNLTFLSKMIEMSALKQLNEHLDKCKVLPASQSAYRKRHSTETVLCSVVDDLLKRADDGTCSILILLDLSAAFDTVVHELLIKDLKAIGIEGRVLQWFKNYLTGRHFQVLVKDTKSALKLLDKGVPQGSVLGPILFCIYILELAWILKKYGVECHFYADDTQFYFTIKNVADTQKLVDDIMTDISNWMKKKRLKLNENKTECILIGSRNSLDKNKDFETIDINGVPITLSKDIRDLGVIIDEELNMQMQINSVVKAANCQLLNVAHIKRFLDQDCLKMLINSLIISKIDYCNSLYHNLPANQLKKLQNILHRGARLITGSSRRDRITPILIDLHWLPIKARIEYKICVLTFLALKTDEPGYLKEKLRKYTLPETQSQTRHALNQHRLDQPTAKSKYGDRAFSHSAPRLYNKLPNHIKDSENIVTFKKNLKTFLFRKSYDLCDKTINENYQIR